MILGVASTFTIAKNPPKGGRYVVFSPSDKLNVSPYDRVQFFCFAEPPFGFESDAMFDGVGTWSLNSSHIFEVFLDHRDDLPIFTIVEKRDKYCRLAQVGGVRQVRDLAGLWLSVEMIRRAISHGTLELLS